MPCAHQSCRGELHSTSSSLYHGYAENNQWKYRMPIVWVWSVPRDVLNSMSSGLSIVRFQPEGLLYSTTYSIVIRKYLLSSFTLLPGSKTKLGFGDGAASRRAARTGLAQAHRQSSSVVTPPSTVCLGLLYSVYTTCLWQSIAKSRLAMHIWTFYRPKYFRYRLSPIAHLLRKCRGKMVPERGFVFRSLAWFIIIRPKID